MIQKIGRKSKQKFELVYSEQDNITGRAGLGLFDRVYEELGIGKDIKRLFSEPGSWNGYDAEKYIKPILMSMLGGGQYIEDVNRTVKDEGLRKMLNLKQVPSSDAIGDWLRRESESKMEKINEIIDKVNLEIMKRDKAEEYMLDIDASCIESWKEGAKWTYKENKGYMPLLSYIRELDICISNEFREGNESPRKENLEQIKECVKKVKMSGKKLSYVRIDAAGYSEKIMNYCDDEKIKYTISASRHENILEGIKNISEWKEINKRSGEKREYGEMIGCMNNGAKSYRIVVERKELEKDLLGVRYGYKCIATNYDEENTGEEIIRKHEERGASKNYHKELKRGFHLSYMPSGDFRGNGVWFSIGVLAYNMFIFLKRMILKGNWVKKTIERVRWELLNVSARIIEHSRKMVIRISGVGAEIYEKLKEIYDWELKEEEYIT
ncbi:IS1380 family transposase [bacterium]